MNSSLIGTGNVNFFIVYKITGYKNYNGYHNSLFAIGHYIYFAHGTTDLILSRASSTTNFGTIQSDNTKPTYNNYENIGTYQSKAKAGQLDTWNLISIHYYEKNKVDGSFVYCNGKKIGIFTNIENVSGGLKIGALSSDTSVLQENIAFFMILNEKMTERSIKLIHHVLCTDYGIDHDTIQF